jgi:hypothetical protein
MRNISVIPGRATSARLRASFHALWREPGIQKKGKMDSGSGLRPSRNDETWDRVS